jgi:periplasmic divalent cation tolerance protein
MSFIDVYITYPNREEATKVVRHLMDRHLVACGNIYPIESTYWWRGKVEKASEFILLVKTRKGNWAKVKAEVEKTHPYEVPCIVRSEVTANANFEKWVEDETRRN